MNQLIGVTVFGFIVLAVFVYGLTGHLINLRDDLRKITSQLENLGQI